MTWRGYNGSQMEYQQLRSGRLLVPHGSLIPHARAVPPTGRHETVIQFSDDGGTTWKLSKSKLIAPCYPGFNGSNEGACEPAFEELKDGRIWMLMRTTAGFLYESFSSDHGTTWAPARARCLATTAAPPTKSTCSSCLTLSVGVFVPPPISEQYIYESTMLSPTTCTLSPEKASSVDLRSPIPTPSVSINTCSFSTPIRGGSRLISREDEYTMSPGVKMISPP